MGEARDALCDQTCLITGGSGTFGSAFIRYALRHGAARVIAVSRNSDARYRLAQSHRDEPRLSVYPCRVDVLADVLAVCELVGQIDVIVHAAAEKHIATGQAFKPYTYDVNVIGGMNVLDAAQRYHIRRVIDLSSDKACEPVNFYGETKAEAERLFIQAGYTVVRYGNVVGSSGSVLPLFIQQRTAGRITITDRRMTRFFMPVADDDHWRVTQMPGPEPVISAVGLVVYALTHGAGGDLFVPTIPSASIQGLAEEIGPDCVIEETGIRDGEKLHEKLVADAEVKRTYRLTEGVFLILPQPVGELQPVESGFRYTSDVNPQQIRVIHDDVPASV